MSDLQDLIHTNAHNAFEIGVKTERERIIKTFESNHIPNMGYPSHNVMGNCPACWGLEIIRAGLK